MDARLQEMLDHYEIRKTLSEYCNGCDRVNEPQMAGVYAEDSWDDHGSHKLAGPQFAQVMSARIATTTESMYHLLGQSLIHVDGDEAGSETYFFAVSRHVGEDGVSVCNQLGGRFVDQLVRENDCWKIKRRTVVRDWTISLPIETEWIDAMALTPGERSDADPSFAALSLVHAGPPAGPPAEHRTN